MELLGIFLATWLSLNPVIFPQGTEAEKKKKEIMEKITKLVEARTADLLKEIEQMVNFDLDISSETDKTESKRPKGYIGFYMAQLNEDDMELLKENGFDGGVKVGQIIPSTAAEKYGLKVGDIIIKAENRKLEDFEGLIEILKDTQSGDKLAIALLRGEETVEKTLVLGAKENGQVDEEENNSDETSSSNNITGLETLKKENISLRAEIEELRSEIKRLKESGGTNAKPFIGFRLEELDQSMSPLLKSLGYSGGLKVSDVEKDSPAELSDIKQNDIIVKIDAKKIENFDDIGAVLKGIQPGNILSVTVVRTGRAKTLKLIVGNN